MTESNTPDPELECVDVSAARRTLAEQVREVGGVTPSIECDTYQCGYMEPHKHGFACDPSCPCELSAARTLKTPDPGPAVTTGMLGDWLKKFDGHDLDRAFPSATQHDHDEIVDVEIEDGRDLHDLGYDLADAVTGFVEQRTRTARAVGMRAARRAVTWLEWKLRTDNDR